MRQPQDSSKHSLLVNEFGHPFTKPGNKDRQQALKNKTAVNPESPSLIELVEPVSPELGESHSKPEDNKAQGFYSSQACALKVQSHQIKSNDTILNDREIETSLNVETPKFVSQDFPLQIEFQPSLPTETCRSPKRKTFQGALGSPVSDEKLKIGEIYESKPSS